MNRRGDEQWPWCCRGGRQGSCYENPSGKSHRQTFLDISGSSFTEQWRRVFLRRGLGRADECLQNAPWMSNGAFFLEEEGRCGPEGNHRIIIPLLLIFSLPTHMHTFQQKILHWGGKFKGEFNPQPRTAGFCQPLQMVLVTFYKDLCLRVWSSCQLRQVYGRLNATK